MRPLPDLTPLATQPDAYDSATDDFVNYFASNFQSMDALGNTASSEVNNVNSGANSIGQSIDSLGSDLDTATSVFDSLSSDLDAVNLAPDILSYQAADSALDSALNAYSPDMSSAISFFNDFGTSIIDYIYNKYVGQLDSYIESIWSQINYMWGTIDQMQMQMY